MISLGAPATSLFQQCYKGICLPQIYHPTQCQGLSKPGLIYFAVIESKIQSWESINKPRHIHVQTDLKQQPLWPQIPLTKIVKYFRLESLPASLSSNLSKNCRHFPVKQFNPKHQSPCYNWFTSITFSFSTAPGSTFQSISFQELHTNIPTYLNQKQIRN